MSTENSKNQRSKDRKQENREAQNVIVTRIDQHQAHPDDILNFAVREGREQIERSWPSLVASSLAAGLILGFAAMVVAKMKYLGMESELSPMAAQLATALVYPLGFVICILSGTQLFTEHTATAVYPYLDKKCSLSAFLRMLGLVAVGNIVGTFISAILIFLVNAVVKAKAGYIAVAMHQMDYGHWEIFMSAILAGWLMAQGSWLVLSTRADVEKIFLIYIVTFIIGLCGLHHSIVGSAELFAGKFFGASISGLDVALSIVVMLAGNFAGGAIFVGLLNYGHIRKLQE